MLNCFSFLKKNQVWLHQLMDDHHFSLGFFSFQFCDVAEVAIIARFGYILDMKV
jgi:hypothetical protein